MTPGTPTPPPETGVPSGERLDSWKEIADYLKRRVRTVQRWEKLEGLPVHRLQHDKQGTVYAWKGELDEWIRARDVPAEASEAAEAGEAGEEEAGQAAAGVGQSARPGFRYRWPLLALAVLLIAGFAVFRSYWQPPVKVRVAVLPFKNLSGDPLQDYFTDGFTQEMISQVGRFNPERLGVIAWTSVERYKRNDRSAAEIARELRVHYILEGSIRREAGQVRVTAELIQAGDQTQVWTGSYQRGLQDVLALQNEVASSIAAEIRVHLSADRRGQPALARVAPEAHDAYLRGRFAWNRRTAEGIENSITFFQLAISLEPRYALAYAGMADAYSLLGFYGALPPAEVYPAAKAAAEQALVLDPGQAEAHALLADVTYLYDWNWPAAEASFERAIQLNPNYATARQWYAMYLALMGRTDQALAETERAAELDPLSLVIQADRAMSLYLARRYDLAIERCRSVLSLDQNFVLARAWLGLAELQKGNHAGAQAELERAAELAPGDPFVISILAYARARAGDGQQARRLLQQLREMSTERYVSPAYFALVYAGLGDNDAAFEWAQKAYEERSPLLVRLKAEPMMDVVRGDPRFAALLKQVGLRE